MQTKVILSQRLNILKKDSELKMAKVNGNENLLVIRILKMKMIKI